MKIPTRAFILAQSDDLKAGVLRFAACSSFANCAELRRLTLDIEDSFKWVSENGGDMLFIEQCCAAIRGLSTATMDVRYEGKRAAGWGVEDVFLALVRMLRSRVVYLCDMALVTSGAARRCAQSSSIAKRQSPQERSDSNTQNVTQK